MPRLRTVACRHQSLTNKPGFCVHCLFFSPPSPQHPCFDSFLFLIRCPGGNLLFFEVFSLGLSLQPRLARRQHRGLYADFFSLALPIFCLMRLGTFARPDRLNRKILQPFFSPLIPSDPRAARRSFFSHPRPCTRRFVLRLRPFCRSLPSTSD